MHSPIRINIIPEAVGRTFSPLGGIKISFSLTENGLGVRPEAGPRHINWSFEAEIDIAFYNFTSAAGLLLKFAKQLPQLNGAPR